MKLVQKITLLVSVLPLSVALASAPAVCMKPEMLYAAASSGQIHDPVADWHKHVLQAHRWYTVGTYGYSEEMPFLLDKNSHWVLGGGNEDQNGVYCSYYNNAGIFADLQMAYKIPSNPLRQK